MAGLHIVKLLLYLCCANANLQIERDIGNYDEGTLGDILPNRQNTISRAPEGPAMKDMKNKIKIGNKMYIYFCLDISLKLDFHHPDLMGFSHVCQIAALRAVLQDE